MIPQFAEKAIMAAEELEELLPGLGLPRWDWRGDAV